MKLKKIKNYLIWFFLGWIPGCTYDFPTEETAEKWKREKDEK